MGALDGLKNWFSLKDAADYVSSRTNSEISQVDLLELAAEEMLELHYNLVEQKAAALPNHDKWEDFYSKFSPKFPKQSGEPKDDVLYGKYRMLPTADFLSGLRSYCHDLAPYKCPDLTFVVSDKTGQIYMLCGEYSHGVQTITRMSIMFSSEQVVVAKNHIDELIKKIGQQEKTEPLKPVVESEYVSPYIELMECAIRENAVTVANQSKHGVLKQWFLDNAPIELGVTANKAGSMATLVRLPEAAVGGNKKPK